MVVYRHNGNILHADEHADKESGLFQMRVEFDPKDRSFLDEFLCLKVRFAVSKGASSTARKFHAPPENGSRRQTVSLRW
jgi:formyltetrahydrofolate hydrolase